MSIKVLNKPNVIIGESDDGTDANLYKLLANTLSSYTLPRDVGIENNLRSYAFYHKNIFYCNLNNQDFVPSDCFGSCINLSYVGAKKAKIVYGNAFRYCPNLEKVSCSPEFIRESAFANCISLSTFDFKNTLEVGSNAFHFCSKLNNIDLTNVLVFSANGFQQCTNLKRVEAIANGLPSSLFTGCSNLSYAKALCSALGVYCFSSCTNLKKVEIPFCHNILSNCFNGCINLESAFIPFVFSNLSSSCFLNCSELSEVTVGCYKFSASAFYNCSKLERINILSCFSTPIIERAAFTNTPILDSTILGRYGSIYVPSNFLSDYKQRNATISDRFVALSSEFDEKFIYQGEFISNSSITEMPSEKLNAEYVCVDAFRGCTNLSSVSLSKCKAIGSTAFAGCTKLDYLSIPECQYIGYSALYQTIIENLDLPEVLCANLAGISKVRTISAPKCKLLHIVGASSLTSIYAPECLSLTAYSVHAINELYLSKVVSLFLSALNNVSQIYAPKCKHVYILRQMSKVTSLDFPECVVVNNADNMINTRFVNIPNCLELNGDSFSGFSALTSINARRVQKIAGTGNAFCLCTSLEKLRLDNLNYINASAFRYCYNLKKVLFPKLYNMAGGTFYNCSKLESVYLFNSIAVSAINSTFFSGTPIIDSSFLGHYGSIYVPAQLISYYQNDKIWSYFSERFVGLVDEQMQYIIDHFDDEE